MSRPPRLLRSTAAHGLAAWLLATLVVAPPGLPAAQAGPKGEKVVKGKASFSRDGDVTVIRTGKRAIIEYTGFDISTHETVRFEQPNAKSRVLNRISGDPTRIDGKLAANGIVYLVNPSGVFFGRSAVVEVRSLVAAAGDLPDRKFLREVDAFSLSGPVENLGSLEGSAVKLLGRSVANGGSIVAPDGVIALVAGERVVLTQLEGGISIEVDGPPAGAEQGIAQSGLVDAGRGTARFAVGDHYSLAINHSGVTRARDIELAGGEGGLVRVAGTLDASAREPGATGGSVRATGDRVALEGALLDASGTAGGGGIRVGGDLRGEGPLPNARRTFVDSESVLRADALESGDGGSAVVFGEEAAGVFGQISARGGAAGGDGGFAELSSEGLLVDEGSVDLRAPAGAAGTLLYDPRDIVLVGGTLDGADAPDTSPDRVAEDDVAGQVLYADGDDLLLEPFQIFESELEGTDANIVLEARNSISVAAGSTFDHDAGGEGAGVVAIRPDRDLTLRTRNDPTDDVGSATAPGIDLTGSAHGTDLEFRTSGEGTILLLTGAGDTDGVEASISAGMLRSGPGGAILATEDGSITVHSVTTSGSDGATGGDGGNIIIDAGDDNADGDTAVLVTGNLTARGGNGTSGSGGVGGGIGVQTRQATPTTGGGTLTVMGTLTTRGGDSAGTDAASAAGDGGRVELATVAGNLVVGGIDTSGGNTAGGEEAAGGGAGGSVSIETLRQGDILLGDIVTRGGDALSPTLASDGGFGGNVNVQTGQRVGAPPMAGEGDIAVGDIDTRGGDTDGNQTEMREIDGEQVEVPLEFGGTAGSVAIFAGVEGDSGDGGITLNGNMVLLGGSNGVGPEDAEGFGGTAELRARDAIEHAGQAGPHITTQANVIFNASDVGGAAPISVSGGGTPEGLLGLGADGVARVEIDAGSFDDLQIVAFDSMADVQVVEGGTQIVRIQNSQVVQGDTSTHGADLVLGLQDRLVGTEDAATNLELTVRTGSIVAGGNVRVLSEDDILIGDSTGTVAVMRAKPPDPDDPGAPSVSGALILVADSDSDEKGRIRDGVAGAAGGVLDLRGNAQESGGLIAVASDGIGESGNPLVTTGGGPVAMSNGDSTTPLNGGSGGIYLRNEGSGVLRVADLLVEAHRPSQNFPLAGVTVVDGPGDIELENTADDLVIEEQVSTSGDDEDLGGAVTLRAAPGSSIVLQTSPADSAVDANQTLTFDGDVTLMQDGTVVSRKGDVDFNGTIDTDLARGDRVRSLSVFAAVEDEEEGVEEGEIRLAGDVGITNDLRDLVFGGDVVLEGGVRRIDTTNLLAFRGDVRASSDDAASLAILAGPRVEITGDVGAAVDGRLAGLSIARNDDPPFANELPDPLVLFSGDGAQTLRTGAGGIAFTPAGLAEVPDRAMVAKTGGDLSLVSEGGSIDFGPNQKLTVQGNALLVASSGTVRLGDVSALELRVTSPDARVRAREPGPVLLQSGGSANDEGADLVANLVEFSTAPTIEGTGPAPRIATPGGVATNPGALLVVDRVTGIGAGDMLRGITVLDLAILPPANLPNETPQQGPVVSGLVTPRPSQEAASGSALAPGAEETLAYLRCRAEQRDDCAVVPASPLDSARGAELAADAARLLGDSGEARELRGALAQLEPGALRELAVFLTEIRLLGLSEEEYRAVRDALYREILADRGPGAPDAHAFAEAVEGQARGVRL